MASTRAPAISFARLLLVLVMCAWTSGCASLPSHVDRTPSTAWNAPERTSLGQLAQQRHEQAHALADSGFHLLDSVDEAYAARLALIDRAQRTLDLQYYAVHADPSTELLLDRLRAAAARGVRVRVLLDDFNTTGEDAQVMRLAFVPNVQMRLFNPVPGSRLSIITRVLGSLHETDRLQKRMHNKLFIADNAWGITGGRNLGDAYFGGDERSAFVDLDVLAAGRVVRAMSASFDRYWNDDLAYPVQALLDRKDLERLRAGSADRADKDRPPRGDGSGTRMEPAAARAPDGSTILPNVSPSEASAAARPALALERIALNWASSALLADRPEKVEAGDNADAGPTVIDGLLGLLERAQREVLVISPYFVPGRDMLATFARLRQRGVSIRVLTNSLASNDAPAAHAGYARWRPDLLRAGVELHEMRADPGTAVGLESRSGGAPRREGSGGSGLGSGPGGSKSGTSRASLHSKAVIIDRSTAVIGSMNLDLRSRLKNSEVALLIRSGSLAQRAAELIERTFDHSAYQVLLRPDGSLLWKAPPGAGFADSTREPDTTWKQRLLLDVIAPLAPDEML